MVNVTREEQKRQASEALKLRQGLSDYAELAHSALEHIADSAQISNDTSNTPGNT